MRDAKIELLALSFATDAADQLCFAKLAILTGPRGNV